MTREEAARILDPETSREALDEIEYYGGFRGDEAVLEAVNDACRIAADVLRSDLLARAEAAEARAEKAEREVERLKGIMRSDGIMVIPSKYPGCKSEWNLPKRGQKEE